MEDLKLSDHIKKWNEGRIRDIQDIMNNPSGEWERGIMLTNACMQDLNQMMKWFLTVSEDIEKLTQRLPKEK